MLRNFIFKFFFYLGLSLICILFLPALFLPKNLTSIGGKMLGYWAEICLKIFLSTKITITGRENIVKNEKFFVACTHQSMFETFYLQTIFNAPFFVLKKELINIPIFGNFLKKLGCISISRGKVDRDNLDFLNKIKVSLEKSNGPLIIFPQGTRYNTLERPNFKKGVMRIYNLNIKCQPVVMNSGDIWPKEGKMSYNKELKISILNPVNSGMKNDEFIKSLENSMYKELDRLTNLS